MRGLAIFTLNSTYLFDDGDVMWIPNDRTRQSQQFGDVTMLSGIWYPVVLKPTLPEYDYDSGTNADIKPVHFSFKKRNYGEDDEIVNVITSRLRTYVHMGEGSAEAFRTEADSYNIAKDTLLGAIDELGTNLSYGKPTFGRQVVATRKVMTALGISLSEARRLVKQVETACLTVEVKVNETPLADWERQLIDSQY